MNRQPYLCCVPDRDIQFTILGDSCWCSCIAPPPPTPSCLEDVNVIGCQWDRIAARCNTPGWSIADVLAAAWGGHLGCARSTIDPLSLR